MISIQEALQIPQKSLPETGVETREKEPISFG